MSEVDVRGFSCPIPIVKTKKAMEEYPNEALTVLVKSTVSREKRVPPCSEQGIFGRSRRDLRRVPSCAPSTREGIEGGEQNG
jgi:tRNA 2-thiouridine synthesizing protein A